MDFEIVDTMGSITATVCMAGGTYVCCSYCTIGTGDTVAPTPGPGPV